MTRTFWHWAITVAVLATANVLIWRKEAVVRHGTTMLLRLAPVDPRSLMQGDYMRLNYEIASNDFNTQRGDSVTADSVRLIVRLDHDGVASFVRLDDSKPLADGEQLLQAWRGPRGWRLGAESFFFQEGQADLYAGAKYGELRVAKNGSSVLIGLCDEHHHRLGGTARSQSAPPPPAAAATPPPATPSPHQP